MSSTITNHEKVPHFTTRLRTIAHAAFGVPKVYLFPCEPGCHQRQALFGWRLTNVSVRQPASHDPMPGIYMCSETGVVLYYDGTNEYHAQTVEELSTFIHENLSFSKGEEFMTRLHDALRVWPYLGIGYDMLDFEVIDIGYGYR